MKKYILIKADTNDADYVEKLSEIGNEAFFEVLEAVVKELTKFKEEESYGYNWPNYEYVDQTIQETYPNLTEEQIEWFNEYVPRGEYGIHSIVSIRILTVESDETILTKY